MAAKTYSVMNGAAPGAAAIAVTQTGTVIKTHIQIATHATTPGITLIEWWAEFNGFAAAAPGKVELLAHSGGPCTGLTAYLAADITKENDPNAPASSIQLGTALSGWGPGTEVTPTTPRNLETHLVSPTSGVYIQFPSGREPTVAPAQFARLRCTFAADVGLLGGVMFEE